VSLRVVPCDRARAHRWIKKIHRHHKPHPFDHFCLAVVDESGSVRGVATVGRPVSRELCDGFTVEVNRVATDGTRNACSMLYGACRRAAFALGWRKIITYTLPEEGGASLRGAGWACEGEAGGGSWSVTARGERGEQEWPKNTKLRWSSVNPEAFGGGEIDWPTDPPDPQPGLFALGGAA
jgi:hypothetical protein